MFIFYGLCIKKNKVTDWLTDWYSMNEKLKPLNVSAWNSVGIQQDLYKTIQL